MNFQARLTLATALLAALPLLAQAQLSSNISLTSNYKVRGQDQDSSKTRALKPALQGGFDYNFGNTGFYLSNWNSSVDWLSHNSLEIDLSGGYQFKAGGVDLDMGAITYLYPGNSAGHTTEVYGAASYGPFRAKYSHTLSRDYFDFAGATSGSGRTGRNTGYLNIGFARKVAPSVSVEASLGFTRFSSDIRNAGTPNFMDYSVGGVYHLAHGLSLSAALVGANKQAFFGPVNKSRIVVTLTRNQ
ncbi:TorF family putative porin [Acidovorax sp. Be4]|uniref:TorF family putative porin n=1 Tax=Acidovorax bellezanensis TaxID=2976702 RepID=A0ABT2PJ82_9BURK|nr:TorF family putative porin [Acidovorax sp. Be4]MCT9810258.1 TorF family putative porin [Acidovorax sp. Be4]